MTTDPQTADEATPVAVSPAGANETAASVAAPPTTEQTALRERIADAIRAAACPGSDCPLTEAECSEQRIQPAAWERGVLSEVYGRPEWFADAVLAVLPAPADRAATLRAAADRYEEILANADTGHDPRYWTAVRDITLGLRAIAAEAARAGGPSRGAAEAPQPETPDEAPPREPHPTEADLHHALAVFARFHGRDTDAPAVVAQPGKETSS
ncbi:hypothetical protein [Streptomyces europaeiscabiei]|uniref:hypothetical protein n=1 Tax=Streptomyces europaeiscabiei TaxID=146819 RepID=UPI0029B4F606|nr:hypothetical protein [Streptomyces europaeiscabiei]MDX2765446.1 hypothetical protein [Streptomyces europaeiscabiei]